MEVNTAVWFKVESDVAEADAHGYVPWVNRCVVITMLKLDLLKK